MESHVKIRDLPSIDSTALAVARARVRRSLLTCQACPLHLTVTAPTPYAGPRTPILAAVGEAPGPTEEQRGIPFVGASGKLLRALFRDANIDPDMVFYCNTVSCHPKKQANFTRTPTDAEQLWCRDNLQRQLELINTRYVLLVGATALKVFRSDLRVTEHHGRCFVWMQRYVVMPILHPAAALRHRALKDTIRKDLQKLAEIIENEEAYTALDDRCVKCGGQVEYYDPDGVGYCWDHWRKYDGLKTCEKERRRWTRERNVPMTLELGEVPIKEGKSKKKSKRDHA